MIFDKKIINIRVIAPAASLANLAESNRELAEKRLNALGFNVSFGQHAFERDEFGSSSVQSMVLQRSASQRLPAVRTSQREQ